MTDSLSIFRSGILLMPTQEPAAETAPAAESVSFLAPVMILLCMFACMLLLGNIINAMPSVFDSFLRLKGSVNLEGSVRIARDRNLTAAVMILPFVLVLDLSGLYSPDFLQGFHQDVHLLMTLAIFLACLILRMTLFVELKPRRGYDNYLLARKAAWNIFIVLALTLAATFGLMRLLHAHPIVTHIILLVEAGGIYLLLLVRRSQILSASCNPFTTFLYLCALEILPTGLWVMSAILL